MVELASTLPNSGGVVGFFTGENDLSTFGTQLLSFGLSIKAYSLAVKGLDTNAVENSAVAGQALVELANTPAQLRRAGIVLHRRQYYLCFRG